MHLKEKTEHLQDILRSYGRVAIAFSGGIDSAFLLQCSFASLGAGNVLILLGSSVLMKPGDLEKARQCLEDYGYGKGIEAEIVPLFPLMWKEFTDNSKEKCYFCKLRMYTMFREVMEKRGFSVLLDGTNVDDLKENRPGLRALHVLGGKTPLVEAGFNKEHVRACAKQLGMPNWNQPSSSCLATRIAFGLPITEERLARVLHWEEGVERLGFTDCRVRMGDEHTGNENLVLVQIRNQHFELLRDLSMRMALLRFFRNTGASRIVLDLEGRQ